MALMRNNIYELVGESSALSLVSLFVPLIAGLYWKKANNRGANWSMIAGFVVWFVCNWHLPDLAESGELSAGTQPWAEVSPMLYGLLASILGMIAGSLMAGKKANAA
jgi:Na+/proline symporter